VFRGLFLYAIELNRRAAMSNVKCFLGPGRENKRKDLVGLVGSLKIGSTVNGQSFFKWLMER